MAARLWIRPAKEAPVALVIRRKPHRVWHFLRWDIDRDEVVSRDWSWETCYPRGCDISWDGALWFFHMSMRSGLARLGEIDPLVTIPGHGAWGGGGFFESATQLVYSVPAWDDREFKIRAPEAPIPRIVRGGWADVEKLQRRREGWVEGADTNFSFSIQPTDSHPRIHVYRRFDSSQGAQYSFTIPELPGFMDGVFWATYDSQGRLLLARGGVLEKYTLDDLRAQAPSFRHDLNTLADTPSQQSLKEQYRATEMPAWDPFGASFDP